MSVGLLVCQTQVSMCSTNVKTVHVYVVEHSRLPYYNIAVLQYYSVTLCYKSIWEKHLGDIYIVKMIV